MARRHCDSTNERARSDERLARIAGGIAHDFNNRIGAIIGWAELGIEETSPGSPSRRYFERIRQQAERAAALARRLLASANGEGFEQACTLDAAPEPASQPCIRAGEQAFRTSTPNGFEKADSHERIEDLSPIEGGTETILVAEDHDGLRQLARKILAGLGYRVLLAADGEQALRMHQSNPGEIALALLDVTLPGMSGPEVCTRMHAVNPDLPVIFTTGCAPDPVLLGNAGEQRPRMIQKPYTTRELALQIRAALEPRPQAIKVDTPS